MNYNLVILQGNLCRDPEVKQTQGGTSVCEVSIAVNNRAKVNGEWVDRAIFPSVVFWASDADNLAKYFKKGDNILVEGELTQDNWEDQNGNKRQKTKVRCRKLVFQYNKHRGNRGGGRQEQTQSYSAPPQEREPQRAPPPPPAQEEQPMYDEIPF